MREGELLEIKVVRGEEWAIGRNYVVHAGEHLKIEPCFDGATPRFVQDIMIEHNGTKTKIDILLPPSYEEQPKKRYPVLYVSTVNRSGSTLPTRSGHGRWMAR